MSRGCRLHSFHHNNSVTVEFRLVPYILVEIKLRGMKPICVPDITRLKCFPGNYLDTLYGLSKSLEHILVSEAETGEMNSAREKELKKNIESLMHLSLTNMSNLDKLAELVGSAVAQSLGKDHVRNVYESKQPGIFSRTAKLIGLKRQYAIWPVHTFDKETVARYTMIKDATMEHIKQYSKILCQLQKQQKKHSETVAKVKEYEKRLQTATLALSHTTKDSHSGHCHLRAIKKLEITLKNEQEKSTKINTKLVKTQEEEIAVKQSLHELQETFTIDVKSRITMTLQEILGSITKIITNGVNVTESGRSLAILDATTRFDVKYTVEHFVSICQVIN